MEVAVLESGGQVRSGIPWSRFEDEKGIHMTLLKYQVKRELGSQCVDFDDLLAEQQA